VTRLPSATSGFGVPLLIGTCDASRFRVGRYMNAYVPNSGSLGLSLTT